ncbi:MAG: hypothetical protein ACWGPN_11595, partial [Gammaproteobacteria bacterium]
MRLFKAFVAAGLLSLFAAPSQAVTIVLSDTGFDASDWAVMVAIRGIGVTGSGNGMQVLTGGNPDQYWQVMAARDPDDAGPDNSTRVSSVYVPTAFDPSVNGAIATIDFSIDGIQPAGQGASGGTVAPIVIQGGVLYQGPGVSMPEPAWTAHAFAGLTADNFSEVGAPASHPDFSAAGAVTGFGWVFVVSSASGNPVARTVGFDNWT